MEKLNCPSCGSPNITKTSFKEYVCESCGVRSKYADELNSLVIAQAYPCPNCDFPNASGAIFCTNCGNRLIGYCEKCGSENSLGSTFCSKCGEKFVAATSSTWDIAIKPFTGPTKIAAIKMIRALTGLGLVEGKELVERGGVLGVTITAQQAKDLIEELAKGEVVAELRPSRPTNGSTPTLNQKTPINIGSNPTISQTGGGCMAVFLGVIFLFGGIISILI